jgi:hypothetical protein
MIAAPLIAPSIRLIYGWTPVNGLIPFKGTNILNSTCNQDGSTMSFHPGPGRLAIGPYINKSVLCFVGLDRRAGRINAILKA